MAWLGLQIPSILDRGTPGAPGEIGVSLGPLVNQSWGDHVAPSRLFAAVKNHAPVHGRCLQKICLYVTGSLTNGRQLGRMDVIGGRFAASADRWMCFVALPFSAAPVFALALLLALAFFSHCSLALFALFPAAFPWPFLSAFSLTLRA